MLFCNFCNVPRNLSTWDLYESGPYVQVLQSSLVLLVNSAMYPEIEDWSCVSIS